MKVLQASDKHKQLLREMDLLFNSYSQQGLDNVELLAIAALFVGKVVSIQCSCCVTQADIQAIVNNNISAGVIQASEGEVANDNGTIQ